MEKSLYSVIVHPIAKEIMQRVLVTGSNNFYEQSEENLLGLLITYISVSHNKSIDSMEQIPFVINEVHRLLIENPTGEKINNLPNTLSNANLIFLENWADNAFFATSEGWEVQAKERQIMFIRGLQRKLELIIAQN